MRRFIASVCQLMIAIQWFIQLELGRVALDFAYLLLEVVLFYSYNCILTLVLSWANIHLLTDVLVSHHFC
jgi:hypothetical protein